MFVDIAIVFLCVYVTVCEFFQSTHLCGKSIKLFCKMHSRHVLPFSSLLGPWGKPTPETQWMLSARGTLDTPPLNWTKFGTTWAFGRSAGTSGDG